MIWASIYGTKAIGRVRIFFSRTSPGMPTANAEGVAPMVKAFKGRSRRRGLFRDGYPLRDPLWPLGVRRRHAPKERNSALAPHPVGCVGILARHGWHGRTFWFSLSCQLTLQSLILKIELNYHEGCRAAAGSLLGREISSALSNLTFLSRESWKQKCIGRGQWCLGIVKWRQAATHWRKSV